jgi:hypothetical protein
MNNETRIISAQRFLDEDTVAEKQAAKDYDVLVSPAFDVDGWGSVQVILDGHHSLAAAKRDGVAPTILEADATDSDRVSLIERGEIEDFLELSHIDSDYYDTATGCDL